MYQPSRRPVVDGVIEVPPVTLLVTGAGTFLFKWDASSGRIIARHSGLGINSVGNLVAQIRLPDDFERFETDALEVIVRREGNSDSLIITLSKDGVADAVISASDIRATLDVTYETKLLTPGTEYKAGDILLATIVSTVDPLETNSIAGLWLYYIRRP